MNDVLAKMSRYSNYHLCLPESFEWLLLNARTVMDMHTDEVLADPVHYVESAKYFSWEQFFTDLLILTCAKTAGNLVYTKSKLNDFFLQESNIDKVLNSLRGINLR